MHVPKVALLGLGILGALVVGWLLHATTAEGEPPRMAAPVVTSVPYPSPPAPDLGATPAPVPPVYVTIVNYPVGGEANSAAPNGPLRPTAAPRTRSPASPPQSTVVVSVDSSDNNPIAAQTPADHPVAHQAGDRDSGAPMPQSVMVAGLSVIANGDHIVIAADGSIVSVGDNTVVRGNTGDATASGTIAVDVSSSSLSSGNSTLLPGSSTVPSPLSYGSGGVVPWGTMPLTSYGAGIQSVAAAPGTRAVGISGWENHSIEVVGDENLVTYDDSNLFYERVGQFNGNTGDTDTSGLNVVDAVSSRVRSGDSGNSDESPDPPPFNPGAVGSSPGGLLMPAPGVAGASVADINGVATASAADSLVIGGDGVDDNGVRVYGNRNVAVYDDGNVAVRGSGDVNAEIGDSDTSGAVVMAVRDSDISSGDSFLPASQQAGAQPSDPFDGDDPDVSPTGSAVG